MATKLLSYCAEPSCPVKVAPPSTRCPQHQQLTRQHERRHHSGNVNYGRRWRKLRALYLGMHPFCVQCEKEGREVLATDVHHVNRHEGDYEAFWNGPFQALCKTHHSRITAAETGWRGPR